MVRLFTSHPLPTSSADALLELATPELLGTIRTQYIAYARLLQRVYSTFLAQANDGMNE